MMRRRPLLAAAVVGGTAYHMGKRGQQSRDAEAEQNQQIADLQAQQQQQAAAQVAAPAPGSGLDDQLIQIQKLSAMKDQGVITEEEFAAKKAQILGI